MKNLSITKYELIGSQDDPEEAYSELKKNPSDEQLRRNFFRAIASFSSVEKKKYLNRAAQEMYLNEKVTVGDLNRDLKAFIERERFRLSNELARYIDHESGIEFTLDPKYSMFEHGVYLIEKNICICRKPIFVTQILKDPVGDRYFLRLVSYRGNERIERIVPNQDVLNLKGLTDLSQFGFPTNSSSARELVSFLDSLIFINEKNIPMGIASSQLGLYKNFFIFPESAIGPNEEIPVHFILNDPPPRMFESRGDRNVYINFIRGLRVDLPTSYTVTIFCLYAALASFLLEKQGSPNSVINLRAESGEGKTTLIMIIGSTFGNPKLTAVTWDSTPTFIDRRAAVLNGFPLIIDESSSKLNAKKGELARILYSLAEGKSRGKAPHDSGMSTMPVREFHLITFSSGEISLLSDSDPSGSQMRMIEIDTIFGITNPEFIRKVESVIYTNYGLLAREFVRKLLSTDLSKYPLFKILDPTSCTAAQLAKINHLDRVIRQLQPIYIAGCLAEEIFDFGYDPREIVLSIYEQLETKVLRHFGIPDQFMPWLRDFVSQNPDRFVTYGAIREHLGQVWGMKRGSDLLIIKSAFDSDIMRAYADSDGRYARSILSELAKKGIIHPDSQGNLTRNMGNMRVVYFPNFFVEDGQEADPFGE